MDEAGLAELAGIVGAGGAALAVLAGRRASLLAGAGGLVVVALAAAVFVRFPLLTIPALVVAAPFRPPVDFDREYRLFFALAEGGRLGRLIPLYAVLTASAAAFLYRALRRTEVVAPPRLIAVPTAAFLAFASLSLLWSRDIEAGANLLAFFLLPFAALVAIVVRGDLAPWLPRALAVIAIGLASVFAAVGLWQQATKELLFYEPELEVANAYSPFFRVTSLFTDPSLYGRHVVLGFAVLLVLLWADRINLFLAAGIGTLLFTGLYFSYSQTSMASLFAVAFVVTLLAGDRGARRAVVAAAAVVVLAATAFLLVGTQDESLRDVTSGRWNRVEGTADVVREAPLFGVGLGAQPEASQDLAQQNGARTARFVSHTTPLTVAAELGIVGFAIYALLLAAAIRMILLLRRRDLALALSLGAVLLALFVHALAYSGFFEDPVTWLTLGIGAAYLAAPVVAREPAVASSKTEPAATGQP